MVLAGPVINTGPLFTQITEKTQVNTPALDLLYHGLIREGLQAQDFGTTRSGICKDGGR